MSNHHTLPLWPSRGHRRRLDLLWLEHLESDGVAAHIPNPPAQPPPELLQGIEEFNRGQFWQCHETLEHLWRATPYPLRHFYHAIIKLAVGFYHLEYRNRKGARAKLSEGLRLLKVFSPSFIGLDIEELYHEADRWLEQLEHSERLTWEALLSLPRPHILPSSKPS